jgi:hypothetical protein
VLIFLSKAKDKVHPVTYGRELGFRVIAVWEKLSGHKSFVSDIVKSPDDFWPIRIPF